MSAFYGDFQALFDIDVAVEEGETVAIIGANGAGKTTFLRAVAGALETAPDMVLFEGRPIGDHTAHEIVRLGIAMVPEGRRLFPEPVGRGEPAARRLQRAPGPWSLERRLSSCFRCCTNCGALPATGALGRPAADGGDRPRFDVEPAAAAVRRAVASAWRRW